MFPNGFSQDWGYVLTEPDRPGKLDADKAQSVRVWRKTDVSFAQARKLGIPPGPLWGALEKNDQNFCSDPKFGMSADPKPRMGRLKKGKAVTLDDGSLELSGEEKKGA